MLVCAWSHDRAYYTATVLYFCLLAVSCVVPNEPDSEKQNDMMYMWMCCRCCRTLRPPIDTGISIYLILFCSIFISCFFTSCWQWSSLQCRMARKSGIGGEILNSVSVWLIDLWINSAKQAVNAVVGIIHSIPLITQLPGKLLMNFHDILGSGSHWYMRQWIRFDSECECFSLWLIDWLIDSSRPAVIVWASWRHNTGNNCFAATCGACRRMDTESYNCIGQWQRCPCSWANNLTPGKTRQQRQWKRSVEQWITSAAFNTYLSRFWYTHLMMFFNISTYHSI